VLGENYVSGSTPLLMRGITMGSPPRGRPTTTRWWSTDDADPTAVTAAGRSTSWESRCRGGRPSSSRCAWPSAGAG